MGAGPGRRPERAPAVQGNCQSASALSCRDVNRSENCRLMQPATVPVVVKLGGSFAFSAILTDWIRTLASCAGRVVIVPGGGPFADAVRTAQLRMGFDHRAAHLMSIPAMVEYR